VCIFDVALRLSFILFDNFVEHKHDELPECSGSGRGHHCDPRLLKLEAEEQGLRHTLGSMLKYRTLINVTYITEKFTVHGGKVGDER
jgi:hypothetical protein